MNTVEKLAQIHADHSTAWAAFRAAIVDCKDIAGEISHRISEDQQRNAERLEELQEIIADDDRTETARRMAHIEWDRLKGMRFRPTAAELEAYRQELDNAQTALRDVRQLREDFKLAYEATEKGLVTLRKDVLGNGAWVACDNWLTSAQTEFERLSRDVVGNA